WVEDCATGEFMIDLDFTSLGDSPGLIINYDASGTPGSVAEVALGTVSIGPFVLGDVVNITVEYGGSPECDIIFTGLEPFSGCPIQLVCGGPATPISYCYNVGEEVSWLFEGLGTGSILIDFASGMIGGGDVLTIYDGADATAPVLFQHIDFIDLDLANLVLVSTSSSVYMTLVSDGFGSCGDAFYLPMEWSVACLDCALPEVSISIVEDCANNAFTIEADIASTGDGTTVGMEYTVNGDTPESLSGLALGITTLGPFTVNDQVQINVLHESDDMCDVDLGTFTDPGTCPTLVTCGSPDVTETYCYQNSDSQFWIYELVGEDGALYLQFTNGSIESIFYDHLTIYDGTDANAPILFDHTSEAGMQLTGIAVTSTSGSLYMTMSSDGSISCQDGGQTGWEWFVSCLDCSPAVASFSIMQDCANFQYYVEVDVTDLGSDPDLMITNTGGASEVTVTTTGITQIGPFESGTPVQFTLVNDMNALCNVVSPMMVNPLCPQVVCGTVPLEQTYCYLPNDNMAWAYEVSGSGTLNLVFDLGTIESDFYDVLTIYDGPDAQSPILFQHIGGTMELGPEGSAVLGPGVGYYAIDVTSTAQNLYMTLTSDGSVQCDGGFSNFDPMEWHVSCASCQAPGVSYNLVPDCEHLIYKAVVNVTEMTGPLGLQITEMGSGESISVSEVNTYNFATFFDLDSIIEFEVVDLDNAGCTYSSGPLVYTRDSCVIHSCGLDNYEVCYENDEDRWYTYRSPDNVPVAIFFYEGQMLPGDVISIYNGLINEADNLIFSGNNSGNLTGLTVNSSNPDNALTLHVQSNAASSCADGGATIPLRWDVGCGFVGINENGTGNFNMYPNPTNGQLNIDLSGMSGAIDVKVMDMSGRIAYQRSLQDQAGSVVSIDLDALQSGQYLISISTEKWIATKPLQMIR
ncbi:MAG: T9SS type A sorting domain-containing protein, partial [Bacteroidota bacterium]|nr:T9SS type A sorting domain-containing protein [Bacteroidota bacterium]